MISLSSLVILKLSVAVDTGAVTHANVSDQSGRRGVGSDSFRLVVSVVRGVMNLD
jgi:hypothetical protein